MHVESFAVGPLGCTCSVLADMASETRIRLSLHGRLLALPDSAAPAAAHGPLAPIGDGHLSNPLPAR